MIPRRLLFVSLVCSLLISLPTAQQVASQSPAPAQGGVNTTTLKTPRGRVRIDLPNDMAAGDTISGTVIAEPAGKDEKEKQKNAGGQRGDVTDVTVNPFPPTAG